MSRKTSALSREKIATAAIEIADAEGFAAVSMRRIADELGAGTMSLYYYVKTKDDLIAAMDDAFMAEVVAPSLPKNWRAALMAIATRTRDAFLRHPWVLHSMLLAPPGVNAMRHMEQCLEALAETMLTNKEKFALLATLDDFVFGYALRQVGTENMEKKIDLTFVKAQLATGAFPRLAEAFGRGRPLNMPGRFEAGVEALMDKATANKP